MATLRAPASAEEAWIRRCLAAVDRRGGDFGAPLVGGDLAQAPGPLSLSVTALGELQGVRLPSRDRARAGDRVLLTGPVGGSRLGRHLRIEPRVAAGRWLVDLGARALIDVSDGLARDVARLARASAVRIELDQVPLHRDAHRAARADGRTALWHGLHDGEDHELVAVVPPAAVPRALAGAARRAPGLSLVGRVVRGRGLAVEGVDWDGKGGYVHGA